MAAEKISQKSQNNDLFNISELVESEKWDYVLVRLDFMKFYISYSDKNAILKAETAPIWLKCAAFMCKTVASA